jgi:rod shape determining protein RodA
MTIGIMPVTGIPLPFISAGGTSLLTNAAAIGLLLSVSIRRRKLIITPGG